MNRTAGPVHGENLEHATRTGARAGRASGRAATADSIRPRYVDSLSAISGWQANLAGTALAISGILLCVLGLYAAERYMRDTLRVVCFAFGTAMFVGGMVLAVW